MANTFKLLKQIEGTVEIYADDNGNAVKVDYINSFQYRGGTMAIYGWLDEDGDFECEYFTKETTPNSFVLGWPAQREEFEGFPPGSDEPEEWEHWDEAYTAAYIKWIEAVLERWSK